MVLRMSDDDYAAMVVRTPQGQYVPPNNEVQASAPPPRKRLSRGNSARSYVKKARLVKSKKFTSITVRLATTASELCDIDDAECLEGYWDGRDNEPMPGPNRSNSYVQGWWAGMRDGHHREAHPIDHEIAKECLKRDWGLGLIPGKDRT